MHALGANWRSLAVRAPSTHGDRHDHHDDPDGYERSGGDHEARIQNRRRLPDDEEDPDDDLPELTMGAVTTAGDLWLLGRVDDVMNISGHRISTTEIEHALVGDARVAEAAVVGASDATTGQAIVAFVTIKGDVVQSPEEGEVLVEELRARLP